MVNGTARRLADDSKGLPNPRELRRRKEVHIDIVGETKQETGIAAVVDMNDYCKLQKLVSVMAWVRRFVDNVKAAGLEQNPKSKS